MGHELEPPGRPLHPRGLAARAVGSTASSAIANLLEDRGIELIHDPLAFDDGTLAIPGGSLDADQGGGTATTRRPAPAWLSGGAQTHPDLFGQVIGEDDIWAAGDATSFLKQGGIAAQQADFAAESMAAVAGATLEPSPFRPAVVGCC